MAGEAKGGDPVSHGQYGIQAVEPGWITARQIEAARIAMTRHIKRGGKVWINVFPDKPVTQKPAETRMGSGKGNPELWVAPVNAGSGALRAVVPRRGHCQGSHESGHPEAADQGQDHQTGRGILMAKENVHDMGDTELLSELSIRRQKLFDLRFKIATGSLEDTSRVTAEKRQIARILTELREREIAAAEVAASGTDSDMEAAS